MAASDKLRDLMLAELGDRGHADDSAQNELLNAIPQLLAVVEAAEAIMRIPIVATAEMRFVADKQVDLHRSVNALEEAL